MAGNHGMAARAFAAALVLAGSVAIGPAVAREEGGGSGERSRERTASHPGGVPDTCEDVLSGAPGKLTKDSDPPDGAIVRAGQDVTITLRWEPGRFVGGRLHKALDCVTVDGVLDAALSTQERDTANDGDFVHRYTIPAEAKPGTRVCDRGFVSGDSPDGGFEREKSNDVCLTVGDTQPASVPPPTVIPPETLVGGETQTAPAPAAPLDTTSQIAQRQPQSVTTLPVTGGGPRLLLVVAGSALVIGGLSLAAPRRRRLSGSGPKARR